MTIVNIYGYKACECIQTILPHVESELKAAGVISQNLSGLILQGAYSDGSASAGTHTGGGVWDLSIYSDAALKAMRLWGWWASHRTPAQGFQDHNHAVLIGCPHLSSTAKQQEQSFYAGKNGLASNGPDQNLGVSIRTWQQAMSWYVNPPKPVVDLSVLLAAVAHDIPAPTGSTYSYKDVIEVEKALNKEGLLAASLVDGSWGTKTRDAYKAWQVRCGYTGTAADGVPGKASLTKLGNKYGFTVID